MLDFLQKQVVLFDAVIQDVHLRLFSLKIFFKDKTEECKHALLCFILFFYIFLQMLSFDVLSCSACCPLNSFDSLLFFSFSKLPPLLSILIPLPPSSHLNITHLPAFFFSCLFYFFPSIQPRLPGFLFQGKKRK